MASVMARNLLTRSVPYLKQAGKYALSIAAPYLLNKGK